MSGTFVGFGFGAIQGGLFLPKVLKSGKFDRLVVSEIEPVLVGAVRSSGGAYFLNVAESDRIRVERIEGLEILNPLVGEDRERLVEAVAEASELCTALPSYQLYDEGRASVARLLAEGLSQKKDRKILSPAVVYAAENDARAARRLEQACLRHLPDGLGGKVVFSETVIGKMCSVVMDSGRIEDEKLSPLNAYAERAILVESFDRIYVEERKPPSFERGLSSLIEKADLEPFALAKFLGQNATHAALGYYALDAGLRHMSQLRDFPELVDAGLQAYVEEAGKGLLKRFDRLEDELFTPSGMEMQARAAVARMLNPFLADPVERVTRDPVRKLGWDDRLVGAMRIAGEAAIRPAHLAKGARLALAHACRENGWKDPKLALSRIWSEVSADERLAFEELLLERS